MDNGGVLSPLVELKGESQASTAPVPRATSLKSLPDFCRAQGDGGQLGGELKSRAGFNASTSSAATSLNNRSCQAERSRSLFYHPSTPLRVTVECHLEYYSAKKPKMNFLFLRSSINLRELSFNNLISLI